MQQTSAHHWNSHCPQFCSNCQPKKIKWILDSLWQILDTKCHMFKLLHCWCGRTIWLDKNDNNKKTKKKKTENNHNHNNHNGDYCDKKITCLSLARFAARNRFLSNLWAKKNMVIPLINRPTVFLGLLISYEYRLFGAQVTATSYAQREGLRQCQMPWTGGFTVTIPNDFEGHFKCGRDTIERYIL